MVRTERNGKIVYEERNRGCSLGCFVAGVVLWAIAAGQSSDSGCIWGSLGLACIAGAFKMIYTQEGMLLDLDEQALVIRTKSPWKSRSETLAFGEIRRIVLLHKIDQDGDRSEQGMHLELADGRLLKVMGTGGKKTAALLAVDLHVEVEERRA